MQPIVHLLVPVGILLLLRVDRRTALLLSPLAVLPDFDVLFSLHRVLFHNLFFGALIAAAAYFFAGRTRTALLVSSFFFASHLLLDVGYDGSAYLYPFDPTVYGFDFRTLSWVTHPVSFVQVPDVLAKVPPLLFAGTALLSAGLFASALGPSAFAGIGLPQGMRFAGRALSRCRSICLAGIARAFARPSAPRKKLIYSAA